MPVVGCVLRSAVIGLQGVACGKITGLTPGNLLLVGLKHFYRQTVAAAKRV
jgi:hypothetical protein